MTEMGLNYLSRLPTTIPRFEYQEARTIEDACSALSRFEGLAKPIAGGTDLLIAMKNRAVGPQYVVNLKGIPDLDYIVQNDGGLRIGALATLDDIGNSPLCREKFPMLAKTALLIGTPQIRNVATIGGNLCNAAPSADTAPLLIGLGAQAKVRGVGGERGRALEDFFVGPGQSILKADEILTEIQIPNPSRHTRAVYLKLPARTAVDIAVVGVAAVISLDDDKTEIIDAKIVLGAVAPTPMRAHKAESLLRGKPIQDELINRVAQTAAEESQPISDIRGSAAYRKEIVEVLTNRAIRQALNMSH
jgi:carbon-monoxide dehydrogenase medium subunit